MYSSETPWRGRNDSFGRRGAGDGLRTLADDKNRSPSVVGLCACPRKRVRSPWRLRENQVAITEGRRGSKSLMGRRLRPLFVPRVSRGLHGLLRFGAEVQIPRLRSSASESATRPIVPRDPSAAVIWVVALSSQTPFFASFFAESFCLCLSCNCKTEAGVLIRRNLCGLQCRASVRRRWE
jgi:hypothetical protein